MITQLKHGDQIPDWQPVRHRNQRGYIRLRWSLGKGSYVEVTDNRPDNLVVMSSAKEHNAEHRRFDYEQAASLYRSGLSTTQVGKFLGVSAGRVSRALRSIGVEMRPAGWVMAVIHRDKGRHIP